MLPFAGKRAHGPGAALDLVSSTIVPDDIDSGAREDPEVPGLSAAHLQH